MALAAVLLAPFLNTPFTIDDPLFLREAQHVLVDPVHPQAVNIVWDYEVNRPASQILPGGLFVPYLLIPTALSGCKEWVGHLSQLILLLAAVWGTALAALRLGLDRTQARWCALFTATCPAVLGMAGTVMPDIAALLLVILGMERMMAWRDDRRWHQGLAATCWLTLAALTRTHTIVVLAAAFVLLLDGINAEEMGASFRRFPARFLPLALVPAAFFAVSTVMANPNGHGENILALTVRMPHTLHILILNAFGFLADWVLVIPLTIPWVVLRYRQIPTALTVTGLVGASLASVRLGWVAFAAALTCIVLGDIGWDAIRRRDRLQVALWLWLFIAVPVVIYIHLPSKYLVPSVPAAAILVVRLIPEARATARWLMPSAVAAGIAVGLLILSGTRDLAETQRRAVEELISPLEKSGERVWFAGHWGFQWYAEAAGAIPVTLEPPFPLPGETIVVSQIDLAYIPLTWTHRTVVRHFCYPSSRLGRVMDSHDHAGFFSNLYGYLPWVAGMGEASCYEIWRAE